MKIGDKITIPKNLTIDPYNKRGETGTLISDKLGILSIKFTDGTIGKYFANITDKKYAKGGSIENENAEMVLNQNNQIKHHTDELKKVVKSGAEVPAWVVAKINRSANDISDATHYLDGTTKMAKGGNINQKWYVFSSKMNKIVSKPFYNENDAKKYMYELFEKNNDFSLSIINKMEKGGKLKYADYYGDGGNIDTMITQRVKIGLRKYMDAVSKEKINSLEPASPEKYYVLNELEYFKLPYSINTIKDIEKNKNNYLKIGAEYLKLKKQYNDTDPILPAYLYNISDCSKLSKEEKVKAKKLLISYMKIVIKDFKLKKKEFGYRGKILKHYSFEKGGKIEKVMREFKEGKLHSGSKKGPIVRSRKQAIAIALSEEKMNVKKGWSHKSKR